jgi:type IV pilus assembly protein PilC
MRSGISSLPSRMFMESATLEDFQALNEQLAALFEAGVPLEVGLGPPDQPAAQALERINATVVRRISRGETLAEALEGDDQDVPAEYRSFVQLGLRTGDLSAALDGSNRLAESADDSRYTWESSFVYPLIVCCLAFLGLVGFCLFLVPTLADQYESLREAPGPGLRVLLALGDALPYWGTIFPIALLLFLGWRWRARSRRRTGGLRSGITFGWLPGVARAAFQQRSANFAASLAALLDAGTPLDEGLRIAADGCGDANLRSGANQLAVAVNDGRMPGDDSQAAKRFPPFLRWALCHAEATTGRAHALHIAARMYQESAARRVERLRALAPLAVLVLVGGTVTLLYGLALFVPLVELLRAIAIGFQPK